MAEGSGVSTSKEVAVGILNSIKVTILNIYIVNEKLLKHLISIS